MSTLQLHRPLAPAAEAPIRALLASAGICPTCRHVLPAGAPCAADGQSPRAPRVPAERAALIDAVWGTAATREALLAAALPTRWTRLVTALIGTISRATPDEVHADPAVPLLSGIRHYGERIRVPIAAASPRLAGPRADGQIIATTPLTGTPLPSAPAVYALELRMRGPWGERTTLRVALTAGLTIELPGGELVRVPGGPLRLEVGRPTRGQDHYAPLDLGAALDPDAPPFDPWPLFPADLVYEHALRVGDRVRVVGELAPRPAPDIETLAYRAAAIELAPIGVTALELPAAAPRL